MILNNQVTSIRSFYCGPRPCHPAHAFELRPSAFSYYLYHHTKIKVAGSELKSMRGMTRPGDLQRPRVWVQGIQRCQGFTLIELIIFIIISALLAKTILLSLVTIGQNTPAIHAQVIATQTANQCMEWIIGQRRLNGYTSFTCPSTPTPSVCTAPSGYSISTSISCTTIGTDTNYQTVTVTVSGLGGAVLTTLFGEY
jgi:type II secretory pathway pseudopilin PulG